jgi:hypothetical protein
VAIVGNYGNPTNAHLEQAWQELGNDARVLAPPTAAALLGPDAVAVGRVDVRQTLDGVEPGLVELRRLVQRGVRVLNRPAALSPRTTPAGRAGGRTSASAAAASRSTRPPPHERSRWRQLQQRAPTSSASTCSPAGTATRSSS